MLKCGCNKVYIPIEFDIVDTPKLFYDFKVQLPNGIDHSDCLKEKIIQDYLAIIDKLECGHQPDLNFLLEELSLLDIKYMEEINLTWKNII